MRRNSDALVSRWRRLRRASTRRAAYDAGWPPARRGVVDQARALGAGRLADPSVATRPEVEGESRRGRGPRAAGGGMLNLRGDGVATASESASMIDTNGNANAYTAPRLLLIEHRGTSTPLLICTNDVTRSQLSSAADRTRDPSGSRFDSPGCGWPSLLAVP